MLEQVSEYVEEDKDNYVNNINNSEKTNIITILVLLSISFIFYILYLLNVLTINLYKADGTINLLFICLLLLFYNFPGVLLFSGFYFKKNFSKKAIGESDKAFTLLGWGLIIVSILIVILSRFSYRTEWYASLFSFSAVLVEYRPILYIFEKERKKADKLSTKHLIILFFSNIFFAYIIIKFVIKLFIFSIKFSASLNSDNSPLDSPSSNHKKHKIKRNDDDPTVGELVDEYGNPVRDTIGTPIRVTEINDRNNTAKIDGEYVDLEEKR